MYELATLFGRVVIGLRQALAGGALPVRFGTSDVLPGIVQPDGLAITMKLEEWRALVGGLRRDPQLLNSQSRRMPRMTELFETRHAAELVDETEPAPCSMIQTSARRWVVIVVRADQTAEILWQHFDDEAQAQDQAEYFRPRWRGVELVVQEIEIPLPAGCREILRRLER